MASEEEWEEEDIPQEEVINTNVVPEFTGSRTLVGGCIGIVERDRIVNRNRQAAGTRCGKPGKKLLCSAHTEQWLRYLSPGQRTTLSVSVATAPMEGVSLTVMEGAFASIKSGKEIESATVAARDAEALAQADAARLAAAGSQIHKNRVKIANVANSGEYQGLSCVV